MNYINKLRKNVFRNYIFTFIDRFDLTQGIWMIYLASKGLSLTQVGLVEAIFHITSFLMEIPTGAIADIWGRKVSRICGRICKLISAIILIYSNNFWSFSIGFIVSALSYNLESGAGEALLYDSLKELSEEEKYMKVCGINEIIMQIAQTLGLIVGGFLADHGYVYAYGLTILISLLAIFQAFSFTEPNTKILSEEKNFNIFKNQVIDSFNIIISKKRLSFLIVFSQGIFMLNASIFFYIQNYSLSKGFSKGNIGILLAIASLGAIIAATQTYKIEKKIGERAIILFLPIILAISTWGVALSKYYFIFFILINSIDSIIFIAVGDYINKLIPSENRATILSMGSMIFSFYMIIIFPIIGKIADIFSLQVAFEILALTATIMTIINIIILRKNKN